MRQNIANRYFELVEAVKQHTDHHGVVRWDKIPKEYHLFPHVGTPDTSVVFYNALVKWCNDRDMSKVVNEVKMGYSETPPAPTSNSNNFDAKEFTRIHRLALNPDGAVLGRPNDLKNIPADTSRLPRLNELTAWKSLWDLYH